MGHFIDINQFSVSQIESLLQRAFYFKHQQQYPNYRQHRVANLFYENSTRTRVSFECAANNLSMPVINLDLKDSSESKGETLEDTLLNLAAMGIKLFIIRHQQPGLAQKIADNLGERLHVINAGDGTHAHPSQALLDIMTILEHKAKLSQLKIAVVGNIRHSRVANSFQWICRLLGVGELVFVAPPLWHPATLHYGRVTSNLSEGLEQADVVMCLRVQRERLTVGEELDLDTYRRDFALTAKAIQHAKSDAIVMHPGPMNRGIEIDNEVADGPQSVILQQVTNGVFARMAILEALLPETR